jgi:hypothetical protein
VITDIGVIDDAKTGVVAALHFSSTIFSQTCGRLCLTPTFFLASISSSISCETVLQRIAHGGVRTRCAVANACAWLGRSQLPPVNLDSSRHRSHLLFMTYHSAPLTYNRVPRNDRPDNNIKHIQPEYIPHLSSTALFTLARIQA